MKLRSAAYWTTTGFTVLVPCLAGGIGNLLRVEPAVESVVGLGYPVYLLSIIGAWKVLAGLVILAPRLPRMKEWAYAGLAFDLVGASASHAFTGHPAVRVIGPLVLCAIAGASWALRPESRKLAAPASEAATEAATAKGEGAALARAQEAT